MVLKLGLVLVMGYLLGSINTSIIVGKFYGIDVRNHGSGNAGLTNTLRTLGKLPAILVIIGDLLKGILSCYIGLIIIGDIKNIGTLGVMVGGTGAVLGHNWPVYFKFRGGKGILTSLSVIMFMDWKIGLILFGVFAICLLLTKYISLGSIVSLALFPIVSFILNKSITFCVFALILAILGITRHSSNIKRLLSGTENKFGIKKSDKREGF